MFSSAVYMNFERMVFALLIFVKFVFFFPVVQYTLLRIKLLSRIRTYDNS